jgi:hypothetical protein
MSFLDETAKEEEFDSLPNRLKRITFRNEPQCKAQNEKSNHKIITPAFIY